MGARGFPEGILHPPYSPCLGVLEDPRNSFREFLTNLTYTPHVSNQRLEKKLLGLGHGPRDPGLRPPLSTPLSQIFWLGRRPGP